MLTGLCAKWAVCQAWYQRAKEQSNLCSVFSVLLLVCGFRRGERVGFIFVSGGEDVAASGAFLSGEDGASRGQASRGQLIGTGGPLALQGHND